MKRDWLQIVTNFGVILGLIAVVYQINQANNHALANIADSSYQLNSANLNQLMGEKPADAVAKAMTDPNGLTTAEKIVWDARLQQVLYEAEFYLTMAQIGIYDQTFWHNIVERVGRKDLAYPLGRAWWSRNREWQAPEIRLLIDNVLSENPNGALEALEFELPET